MSPYITSFSSWKISSIKLTELSKIYLHCGTNFHPTIKSNIIEKILILISKLLSSTIKFYVRPFLKHLIPLRYIHPFLRFSLLSSFSLSHSLFLYSSTLDILLKHSITFTFFQSLSLYILSKHSVPLLHSSFLHISLPISFFLSFFLYSSFSKYIKNISLLLHLLFLFLSIHFWHPFEASCIVVPVSTLTIIPPFSLSLLLSWQTIKSANGKKFRAMKPFLKLMETIDKRRKFTNKKVISHGRELILTANGNPFC